MATIISHTINQDVICLSRVYTASENAFHLQEESGDLEHVLICIIWEAKDRYTTLLDQIYIYIHIHVKMHPKYTLI